MKIQNKSIKPSETVIVETNEAVMIDESRRQVLRWSTPVLMSVTLPAHAQTSTCVSRLTMAAATASKCSGVPPIGDGLVTLNSDGADPVGPNLQITAINVNGAAATDSIVLPALPIQVSTTTGADIQWRGSASDALTCLPISSITFDVTYRCTGTLLSITQSFDLTTVLANAIP